jgi:hypothetical protein
MAKTGTTTTKDTMKFGGRKGAATPPHADVIVNGEVKAYAPGDADIRRMAASTFTPRHLRRSS